MTTYTVVDDFEADEGASNFALVKKDNQIIIDDANVYNISVSWDQHTGVPANGCRTFDENRLVHTPWHRRSFGGGFFIYTAIVDCVEDLGGGKVHSHGLGRILMFADSGSTQLWGVLTEIAHHSGHSGQWH